MTGDARRQQLRHLAHLGTVGHADLDAEAHFRIVGPVGHALLDEQAVGDHRIDAVRIANRRGTDTDLGHVAAQRTDFDQIARLERTLEQQHQAADQILQHVLHAEAEADRDSAAEEGKDRQRDIDPGQHQHQQHQQAERVQPFTQDPRARGIVAEAAHNDRLADTRQPEREQHAGREDDQCPADLADGDAAVAGHLLAIDLDGVFSDKQLVVPERLQQRLALDGRRCRLLREAELSRLPAHFAIQGIQQRLRRREECTDQAQLLLPPRQVAQLLLQ